MLSCVRRSLNFPEKVPLKHGYNGDLTSRENGSVGGEMVRQMIRRQEAEMADRQ